MSEASKKTTQSVTKRARGGILKALRRSPLFGAGLNLDRPVVADRTVDIPEVGLSMAKWLERTKQTKPILTRKTAALMIRELRDDR